MKILGNGVDIVENYRIKKAIKNKILSKEYTLFQKLGSKKIRDKVSFC